MQLTRISRKYLHITLDAKDAAGQTVDVGEVAVAFLPAGRQPSAAATWIPVPVVDGRRKVLVAGADADSGGATVITSATDVWARATDTPEVDAVKLGTIRPT